MTLAIPSRRRFLFGATAFLAAPAIVRVASIMPVSVHPVTPAFGGFFERYADALNADLNDVRVIIQQYGCLYGYSDKTWELRPE